MGCATATSTRSASGSAMVSFGRAPARCVRRPGTTIRTFSGAAGQRIFDAAQKPEAEITQLAHLGPKPGPGDRAPKRKVSFVCRLGRIWGAWLWGWLLART